MSRRRPVRIPAWALFAIPAAIAAPIVAGILAGGPSIGFVTAAVIAVAIVAAAVRMAPPEQAPPGEGDQVWRGAAARRFLVPLAIAAAGIVLIAATTGVARIVGWGVLAVAVTVAMSLVFLEIGYSEDRARARDERARGGAARRRRREHPIR